MMNESSIFSVMKFNLIAKSAGCPAHWPPWDDTLKALLRCWPWESSWVPLLWKISVKHPLVNSMAIWWRVKAWKLLPWIKRSVCLKGAPGLRFVLEEVQAKPRSREGVEPGRALPLFSCPKKLVQTGEDAHRCKVLLFTPPCQLPPTARAFVCPRAQGEPAPLHQPQCPVATFWHRGSPAWRPAGTGLADVAIRAGHLNLAGGGGGTEARANSSSAHTNWEWEGCSCPDNNSLLFVTKFVI